MDDGGLSTLPLFVHPTTGCVGSPLPPSRLLQIHFSRLPTATSIRHHVQ